MEKEVYESPFTEKMEVEVEGNFCSSGDSATIHAEDATIEVDEYTLIQAEEKDVINHDITFN